mmetsp:Transcript_9960/g.21925  ORF Transcript_9960/g.21925 Transcript_9960/m.21925 type:complete len:217 (+) Transcript_9960:550-1200(+)
MNKCQAPLRLGLSASEMGGPDGHIPILGSRANRQGLILPSLVHVDVNLHRLRGLRRRVLVREGSRRGGLWLIGSPTRMSRKGRVLFLVRDIDIDGDGLLRSIIDTRILAAIYVHVVHVICLSICDLDLRVMYLNSWAVVPQTNINGRGCIGIIAWRSGELVASAVQLHTDTVLLHQILCVIICPSSERRLQRSVGPIIVREERPMAVPVGKVVQSK